jgi:hypothetical protein
VGRKYPERGAAQRELGGQLPQTDNAGLDVTGGWPLRMPVSVRLWRVCRAVAMGMGHYWCSSCLLDVSTRWVWEAEETPRFPAVPVQDGQRLLWLRESGRLGQRAG